MHEIIYFGKIHIDQATNQIIINMLEDLHAKGYNRIFWEYHSKTSLKDCIEHQKYIIKMLDLFPGKKVPEKRSNRTKAQKKEINEYKCSEKEAVIRINELLFFNQDRLETVKARLIMLDKIAELKMEIIFIDVEDIDKYKHTGEMELRHKFMFDRITERLANENSSKSIVITGFAHVVNLWMKDNRVQDRWRYSHGLLRMMSDMPNMKVNHVFLCYSKEIEQLAKAKKGILECADSIAQQISLVNIQEGQWQDIKDLETLVGLGKRYEFDNANTPENIYNVRILPQAPKDNIQDQMKYLTDLGGKNIKIRKERDFTFLQVTISQRIFDIEARRLRLDISRYKIPKINEPTYLEKIQTYAIGITIEDLDKSEYLATYPFTDAQILENIKKIGSIAFTTMIRPGVIKIQALFRGYYSRKTQPLSPLSAARLREVLQQARARIDELQRLGKPEDAKELEQALAQEKWHQAKQIIDSSSEDESQKNINNNNAPST